jgi:hypothetical protein
MAFQRLEKSSPPGGNVQMQCMRSGQHHPGIDMERAFAPRLPDGIPQAADMPHQGILPPFQQVHRKKVSAARHPVPPIIWHATLSDPPNSTGSSGVDTLFNFKLNFAYFYCPLHSGIA